MHPESGDPAPLVTPMHLKGSDLEACLQLDSDVLGGLWTAEQWRSELTNADRLCVGIQLKQQLVAVACGWMVVDELQISLVAVDPEHRRLGLGMKVLLALLQQAHLQGALQATLEVASCNQAALALYQRCGFMSAGRRRNYYSDGRDALIQWCNLSGINHLGESTKTRFG